MTIFVTNLNPETREPTDKSQDSGFSSLDEVVLIMGEPICRGKRTVTYTDQFYSNYSVTEFGNYEV